MCVCVCEFVNGGVRTSGLKGLCCLFYTVHVESELLHTYSKFYESDVILLIVRLAVLTAVTLTVPVVLFPVSVKEIERHVIDSRKHLIVSDNLSFFFRLSA